MAGLNPGWLLREDSIRLRVQVRQQLAQRRRRRRFATRAQMHGAVRPGIGQRQHGQAHGSRKTARCGQGQDAQTQTRFDRAAHGLEAAHLHAQGHWPHQLRGLRFKQARERAATFQADQIALQHIGKMQAGLSSQFVVALTVNAGTF